MLDEHRVVCDKDEIPLIRMFEKLGIGVCMALALFLQKENVIEPKFMK